MFNYLFQKMEFNLEINNNDKLNKQIMEFMGMMNHLTNLVMHQNHDKINLKYSLILGNILINKIYYLIFLIIH